MNSNVVEVAWNCEDADTGAVAAFTEPELLANSLDQLIEAVMADKIAQLVMLKYGSCRS